MLFPGTDCDLAGPAPRGDVSDAAVWAHSAAAAPLFRTPSGEALHDRIILASLAREGRLLDGLSEDERQTLFDLLKRLSANLALVEAHDPGGDAPD